MINIDMVPVEDETEGLALMLHHLKLAAAYFEASPEKLGIKFLGDHFSMPAIYAWIEAMEALYPNEPVDLHPRAVEIIEEEARETNPILQKLPYVEQSVSFEDGFAKMPLPLKLHFAALAMEAAREALA